jgi:hypothetical protein
VVRSGRCYGNCPLSVRWTLPQPNSARCSNSTGLDNRSWSAYASCDRTSRYNQTLWPSLACPEDSSVGSARSSVARRNPPRSPRTMRFCIRRALLIKCASIVSCRKSPNFSQRSGHILRALTVGKGSLLSFSQLEGFEFATKNVGSLLMALNGDRRGRDHAPAGRPRPPAA